MFQKWLAVILITLLPPLIPPYKGGKQEKSGCKIIANSVRLPAAKASISGREVKTAFNEYRKTGRALDQHH